jgi:hypothetical protein
VGLFGITLPTKRRAMSPLEYHLVSRVFGSTLPDRTRILVTDAAGLNRRPFTIPTALLEQVGMGPLPPMAEGVPMGVYRTGYLMNVGPSSYASAPPIPGYSSMRRRTCGRATTLRLL